MRLQYVGRKKELALLQERYDSENFEFGYLYGQRRIGKTTLLEMFRKDKKSLVLFATDSEDIEIRRNFSEVLNDLINNGFKGTYDNWYSFFEAVDTYFKNEKGLVVIDEFPNIVLTRDGKRKKTDFASSLQAAIDTFFKHRQITLILTGSNVSFLEKEISNSRAPLYQRNTFSMLLKKFEWDEALKTLESIKDNNEKAKILALTNTFPYYLSLFDKKTSFENNLDNLFFKPTAIFADDPTKMITTNIATGGLYATILANVSKGYNTSSALCELLQIDSSKLSKYINELIKNDILKKRKNFNSKRNVTYEICDPMLEFYYRFIRENSEWIKTGYGEIIKEEQKNAINSFIDIHFEKECITYLEFLNKNRKLNTFYLDFNNARFDNTPLGRSVELDIVAARNNNLLAAECKFTNSKRTMKDYHDLLDDISIPVFSSYKNHELYIFSKSGFDDSLKKLKDKNLHLIELKTMFKNN